MQYDLAVKLADMRERVKEHSALTPPYEIDACRTVHFGLMDDCDRLRKDIGVDRPGYEAKFGGKAVVSAEEEIAAIYAQVGELDEKHGLNEWARQRTREHLDGLHEERYLGF